MTCSAQELRSLFLNQYALLEHTRAGSTSGVTEKPRRRFASSWAWATLCQFAQVAGPETVILTSGSGSGADLSRFGLRATPMQRRRHGEGPVSFARGTDSRGRVRSKVVGA